MGLPSSGSPLGWVGNPNRRDVERFGGFGRVVGRLEISKRYFFTGGASCPRPSPMGSVGGLSVSPQEPREGVWEKEWTLPVCGEGLGTVGEGRGLRFIPRGVLVTGYFCAPKLYLRGQVHLFAAG